MKELYDNLFKSGDYTKSFEEFVDQFGDTEKSKVLYNALNEAGDYTKSFEEFVVQFGFGEKKKTDDTSSSTLETEDTVSTTEEDQTDGYLDSSEKTDEEEAFKTFLRVNYPDLNTEYTSLQEELGTLPVISNRSGQVQKRIDEIKSYVNQSVEDASQLGPNIYAQDYINNRLKVNEIKSNLFEIEKKYDEVSKRTDLSFEDLISNDGTYQDLKNQQGLYESFNEDYDKALEDISKDTGGKTGAKDFMHTITGLFNIDTENATEITKMEEELRLEILKNLGSDKEMQKAAGGYMTLEEKEEIIAMSKMSLFSRKYQDAQKVLDDPDATTEEKVQARNELSNSFLDLGISITDGKMNVSPAFKKTIESKKFKEMASENPILDTISTFVGAGTKLALQRFVQFPAEIMAAGMNYFFYEDDEYSPADAFIDSFSRFTNFNYVPSSEEKGLLVNENGEFEFSGYGAAKGVAEALPFTLGLLTGMKSGKFKLPKNNMMTKMFSRYKNPQKAYERYKLVTESYKLALSGSMEEARDLGLDKGDAVLYGNSVALMEGVTGLIMPDTKYFKTVAGKGALKSFKDNLKKAASKQARYKAIQEFFTNIGKEIGEEEAMLAYQDIAKTVALTDHELFSDITDIAQQKQLLTVTVGLSGSLGAVKIPSSIKQNRKKIYNDIKANADVLSAMISDEIDMFPEKKEDLTKVNNYIANVKKAVETSPENVTPEQIELLTKKIELQKEMESVDDSFKGPIQDKIDNINKQIADAVQEQETRDIPDAKPAEGVQEVEEEVRVAPEEEAEVESPIQENLQDNETIVQTRKDDKGRVFTTTKQESVRERDGIKVTKFKFNRSDKATDQRNDTFAPEEVALEGTNLEINPEDRVEAEEGETITYEISEIREDETGAAASVKITTFDADGNNVGSFKSDVTLVEKADTKTEEVTETKPKVEPLKTTKPNKKLKDAFDNNTISEEDLEAMTLYALNKKQNKKRLTPFEKRLLEATSVERADQVADLQIKLEDNIEARRAEFDDIRAQKIKESEVEIKTEPATVEGAPDGTYLNIGMIEGKGGRELTEEEIESALPDGVEVLEKTRLEKGENVDEPTLSIKTSRPLTDSEMKAFREATGQLAIPQIVDGIGTMFGTTDWGPFNAEFFVMPDKAKLSDIAKPTTIDESEQAQAQKDPKKSLEKTKKDFDQSEQALRDRVKKPTFKERLRLLREKIFDRQTRVKDLLKGVGNKKATKAKNLLVTKAGATGFANFRFKKADEKIYKGLKDQDLKTLDHIIYLRRLKAINENRKAQGKEPYVGINDTDYDTAVAALKGYEEELGDKKYKDFESRADKYFEAMNESLTRMKDSGLISEEVFNQLKDIDYSPIKTLDYIIPDTADAAEIDRMAEISGIKADVIKTLSDKNLKDIIMDTRWLLSSNLGMIEAKVFENKMLNAFSEAVESAEGDVKTEIENYVLPNPVIGKTKEGKPKRKYDKKTPPGFTKVHFKKDGVDNYMVIDNTYATQLLDIKTKSSSSINLGKVGELTGTNILRFFATSGNPLFIVGNTAVDFANILFLSDVYSNNKFKGGAKLAFDFVKTFGSKVGGTKEYKKIYEEFMEHGGAMDYLSTDGLKAIEGFRGKNKVFNTASKAMKSWGDFMSYLGETSEVSFRVAVYSKVKNNLLEEFKKENGRDPSKEEMEDIMFEAVREARETIDFSQGGSIVKAADKALPYLNAGTQGLRKGVDYAAKNPKGFASSILQAMIMAGGASAASIFMLLRSFDEDEDPKKVLDVLNSISDYEKSNYHILFTGEKDENGEHRYIRVKKLPTIGIASTIAEQLTIKAILKSRGIDYDLNDKALKKSASGISPIDVSQGLPGLINRNPLAAASLTYAYNYDHFYGQDVFKGPRNKKILPSAEGLLDDRVDQVYKDLGQAFGFSPKRSKAAVEKIITSETTNPSIGLIYSGYDKLRGLVGETPTNNEIESVVSKMVKNAEKKLVRSTNKKLLSYKEQDEIKDIETKLETGIYLKEQQAYNDIRKRYENNDPFTSEEFKKYILDNFPKLDAKKYARKYVAYIKNMNGDKSILDIVFEDTPEVQAYRIYKKFGDSFDEDEKKEIGKVFKAAKRKFSKKALYIYNQKYRKK